MAFDDQKVQLIYEAVVRGTEQVAALRQATEQLTQTTGAASQAAARHTQTVARHTDVLLKARQAIILFRRELFAISVAVGTVIAAMRLLGTVSDEAAGFFDKWGLSIKQFFQGGRAQQFVQWLTAVTGKLTKVSGFAQEGMFDVFTGAETAGERTLSQKVLDTKRRLEIDILEARGRTEAALNRKLSVEKAQLERQLQTVQNAEEKARILGLFETRRRLLLEEQRLQELGVKRIIDIQKQAARDVVDVTRLAIRGTLGAVAGESQGGEEGGGILGELRAVAGKVADAIRDKILNAATESIVNRLFTGGGPLQRITDWLTGRKTDTKEAERDRAIMNTATSVEDIAENTQNANIRNQESLNTLQRIQQCVCDLANSMGACCRGRGGGGGGGGGPVANGFSLGGLPGAGFDIGGILAPFAQEGVDWAMSAIGDLFGSGTAEAATTGFASIGEPLLAGGFDEAIDFLPSLSSGFGDLFDFGGIGDITSGVSEAFDFISGLFFRHGGPVPHFQSGGEVPAFVSPGEFVVRQPVAAANQDLLEEMNAGGLTPVRGAQHVFLIKTNDAQSFASMLASPSARNQIETAIIRQIMTNGDVRRVIKEFAK